MRNTGQEEVVEWKQPAACGRQAGRGRGGGGVVIVVVGGCRRGVKGAVVGIEKGRDETRQRAHGHGPD